MPICTMKLVIAFRSSVNDIMRLKQRVAFNTQKTQKDSNLICLNQTTEASY